MSTIHQPEPIFVDGIDVIIYDNEEYTKRLHLRKYWGFNKKYYAWYRRTPKGKAVDARGSAKYRVTPKRRAVLAKYEASPKGKAARARINAKPKTKYIKLCWQKVNRDRSACWWPRRENK
jgi:hypothetical protein